MLLLAAAMFVLVVDTSLMNVSISAVIVDLDTTASGVPSAIAPEAHLDRTRQLLPNAAPARPEAVVLARGNGLRLTPSAGRPTAEPVDSR